MISNDTALMAHLLRRAGFGANRNELEEYLAMGYDGAVEALLNPSDPGNMPDDLIRRYHVEQSELRDLAGSAAYWMYRMISTSCPMEEKTALFWHGLFATGYAKLNQARSLLNQVEMFRRSGLGSFEELLVELSKDPAMIVWLDNNENHGTAINENYGRELLELFSMGIGNYSEDDIKGCARAFTGWTLGNAEYMSIRASKDSIWPYGRIAWHFDYREEDHDDGEKTFLGETGNFNGEDIIAIIVKQESTARFVATRLFQFFAADVITEAGEKTIEEMMATYFSSGYEIRDMLRTLFHSDYFKSEEARFARVKGPVEMVVGAIRMAGNYQNPALGIEKVSNTMLYMGQGLLQPPTVEGWHEGSEWIDSGALVERVNFAAKELSDVSSPGVRSIIHRLEAGADQGVLDPADLADGCLDLLGPIEVSEETRSVLVEYAARQGDLDLSGHQPGDEAEKRVGNMLRLVAATREYQLA
ncbi:MAG: hypothetical protein DSY78_11240 [Chloroflexi bacterium]|jgi:uncharacterized protein (DUF1800 family)|nr:DUF1800 domain-containing protein [Dehalococcoidia bacterium]PKB75701.1 MAG: hypothetical protein BZY85_07900 [SAR202 cluster bacterium MP-SAtl-SRR3965592-G1]PKB85195.1 MAG: hypothetical protein BZY86_03670 [SAR202 cluster bacterium MP-NPac-SRR3961935-G1]RUA29896.1 MAG: hypothetical protein DSY78_11240 [Chloroflexota bacterium]